MKKGRNVRADIISRRISRELQYDFTTMLYLDIIFPQISLIQPAPAQPILNRYYRGQAEAFYKYAQRVLFKNAVEEYIQSQSNDFPFRPYGAAMDYKVALNGKCHLSTYTDRYEYTGGAHGSTRRESAAFELRTGRKLTMRSLFPQGEDYRRLILENAIKLADAENAKNPGIYFDNYQSLMVKYFSPESFILTENGVAIYYQQYEIAPYSTGIVTFEIPYTVLGIEIGCGK